jgi:hypothetical protein
MKRMNHYLSNFVPSGSKRQQAAASGKLSLLLLFQLLHFTFLNAQFEGPNVSLNGGTPVAMTDADLFSPVLSPSIVPILGCEEPVITFPYTYVDKLIPLVDVEARVLIEMCCLAYVGNNPSWVLEPLTEYIGGNECLVFTNIAFNVPFGTISTQIFPAFRFTQTGSDPRIIGVRYSHRVSGTTAFLLL